MNIKVTVIMLSLLGLSSLLLFRRINQSKQRTTYTIGILQTASHPALDAAQAGFMQELSRLLHDDVSYIEQNAQGSVTQAHTIAQQWHAHSNIDGFFTIATLATQALCAIEKDRPIVIAAVTDPNSLGLIHPTTNVSGTTDMIESATLIDLIQNLIPEAHTIGILYTSGELNSLAAVQVSQEEIKKRNLTPLLFAINNESDIPTITDLACRKSDVLLLPNDNTIVSTITAIVTIANRYKKPLIASDNSLVNAGALAACGVDYHESGKQAARIAYEIVTQAKKPYQCPIEQASGNQIFIHEGALQLLSLTIPHTIAGRVTLVGKPID